MLLMIAPILSVDYSADPQPVPIPTTGCWFCGCMSIS
jgi:hypothetical protein